MELELANIDTPQQRKKLVRMLTMFRKIHKMSRHRAKALFARAHDGVQDASIITGQSLEKQEETYLLKLYKEAFPHAPKPYFSVQSKLEGGVRMQYGDEMIELSLQNIAHKFHNL